jgi:hypothetical protein
VAVLALPEAGGRRSPDGLDGFSNVLLWKAQPKAAIVVCVLLPVAGSAVLGLAGLDALAITRRGQLVLEYVPRQARLCG